MRNEELAKKLLSPSKNSRLEKFGKYITFACLSLIVLIVAMILIFVAQKGLSTFFVNGVNVFEFLFGSTWNPSGKEFGALPMILGSFIVTILSALIATPFVKRSRLADKTTEYAVQFALSKSYRPLLTLKE